MEKEDIKKAIPKILLLILFLSAFLMRLTGAFNQGLKATSIVPLLGLDFQTHLLIFNLLWPILMSIVCVILFPLIFVPLILLLKNRIWYKYTNCYIDLGNLTFDVKRFIKRFIYIFLLVLGMNTAILGANIFNPLLLTPGDIYIRHPAQALTENLLYYPEVFTGFALLLLPIVVGLWSVGWTMEDVGLMHFKLPKDDKKILYEIEPVHLKYNGIIKGYAGISAIIYLVSAISFYLRYNLISLLSSVISGLIFSMFLFLPAYYLYLKFAGSVLTKIFRRGKQQAPQMTEKNFQLRE